VNALTLLTQDHDQVKTLLTKLDETTERAEKGRERGLATLKTQLQAHETVEEEIFYPALKRFAQAKDVVLEAYEEHDVVDTIMKELEATSYEDEARTAKFTVMKENLEHHIEEEEGEMFDQARQVMSDDELAELGEEMAARKEALLNGG